MGATSRTESKLRRRLATNVRRVREDLSLSQVAVSERAGLGIRHVQKIEACDVNATLQTIARIADALGVDAVELLSPDGEEGPPT